jgi:hypothetical protein
MSLPQTALQDIVMQLEAAMIVAPSITNPAQPNAVIVPHFIGAAAAAQATNVERVVWTPKSRKKRKPQYSDVSVGEVVREKTTICEVTIYAASFARLDEIDDALEAALADILSDPYSYEAAGDGEISEPKADGFGYAQTSRVAFRAPVFDQVWRKATIDTTTIGSITVKSGSTTEDLPIGS